MIGAGFLAAAASNIAGGASPGLAPGACVSATAGSGSPLDYYVDALLRSNPAANPNTTDLGAARREIASILTKGLGDGDIAGPDRTYVAQVIVARTGLSQVDADKRVSNVIDRAKTDLDNARKAAAKLSLWLTAALLIGAFAASLGGHARRKSPGFQRQSYRRVGETGTEEEIMGRGILLYLLGVPIPIIILLALLRH